MPRMTDALATHHPSPTSKLPRVGTTIFTVMSSLANECGALNLSQGFPDYDGPRALREALARHVMNGHNQYAPMAGVPALREQIGAKLQRSNNVLIAVAARRPIHRGAVRRLGYSARRYPPRVRYPAF